MARRRIVLSWSSGKDSAWALHVLRRQGADVIALLTTLNEAFDRVAMHGVRRSVVEAQARAVGLPLWTVPIPWPCPNGEYERRMRSAVDRAAESGATHVAFGDLFLEDVRAYREAQLASSPLAPLFPLWGARGDTPRLAREMVRAGLRARLACVDPRRLDARFVGRELDDALLDELPADVDPCGENGEFHTVCYAGPMFGRPVELGAGERVERDGYWFADFEPREPRASA